MILFDIHPLFSIILSLLLVNGFFNISKFFLKLKFFCCLDNYFISKKIVVFYLFINSFSILLYSFYLFFEINELIIKFSAFFVVLIGLYPPYEILNFFKKKLISNFKIKLLLFIIVGYFIISLLPITDPDSLDYHLTVPYLSLLNGNFFIQKEWLTSQLSGAGEALSIFGLSIKAYKFSSILQFAGLFSIIFVILGINNTKKKIQEEIKIIVCLCILCIPSFLFLLFTAKPQLFGIATNFVAFILTFYVLPLERDKRKLITIFSIICILCFCATQFKFSFYLSSAIIIFFAIIKMKKEKLIAKSFFVIFIFFILIIFPREYFEYKYLSKDILNNFFNPVTGNPLSESFISSLKVGTGNSRYLPYWLFLPIQSNEINLGIVTEILGLSVLVFLINYRYDLIKKIIFLSIIFFILAIPFGQSSGRFFIEPFLWLMVGSISYLGIKKNFKYFLFEKFIILNSLVILFVTFFTIYNFIPGIFSLKNYKNILTKYANGYNLYQWANQKLPEEAVVLTSHRSFLFSEKPFISYNFRLYLTSQKEFDYYKNFLIQKKPTHILYNSQDHNTDSDILKNCRGKLIAKGNDIHEINPRNPFNKKEEKFDVYIYEADLNKLINCKIN